MVKLRWVWKAYYFQSGHGLRQRNPLTSSGSSTKVYSVISTWPNAQRISLVLSISTHVSSHSAPLVTIGSVPSVHSHASAPCQAYCNFAVLLPPRPCDRCGRLWPFSPQFPSSRLSVGARSGPGRQVWRQSAQHSLAVYKCLFFLRPHRVLFHPATNHNKPNKSTHSFPHSTIENGRTTVLKTCPTCKYSITGLLSSSRPIDGCQN